MKKSAAPSFRSGIKRMRFLTPFLKVDIDKENEFFENLDHKTVKDSNTIQSANTTVIPTLSKSNKPSTSSSESMFQNSSTSTCVNKDTESNVRSDEEILKLISEVDEGKSNSVNAIETTSTANFLDDARTECLFEPYMFSQNINISSILGVLNHRINEYNSEFPKESGYISESKNKIDAVLDPFQHPENIQGKGDLDFQRVSSPKSFEIDAVLDPFQNPENIQGKGDLDSQRVSSPKSFEYKIYSVLHCKRSSKKHKIWEGDGMLIVQNRSAILKDMEGKEIARAVGYKLKDTESLEEGSKFFIGGKECEVCYHLYIKLYTLTDMQDYIKIIN
ncbi:uncharacterized protein LOC118202578 [Stegodyphus dumicola]|uniref:uncharacterized protein LOC118202578 n=1 Tax=Stegodyphus dumicola TaxID=202533 RepID=UPI0015B2DE95|nr:uncharacterized protein LOC118202578 [Stegodyphus dumicola]